MDIIERTMELQMLLEAKNYDKPNVRATYDAYDLGPDFVVSYYIGDKHTVEFFFGTLSEAGADVTAEEYIRNLPDADGIRRRVALETLGRAADAARALGIDFHIEYAEGTLLPG